jgi:putative methionine-R-sulfoxide reductase with GAF domain
LDHYSILGEPDKPLTSGADDRAPADASPANPGLSSPAVDQPSPSNEPGLEATLKQIASQAQYVTGASGAAIALKQGRALVCRAASGTAPEVGVRLQLKAGLTAECIRSGETQRCDNALTDERVDRESCGRLGIESIIVMPVFRNRKLAGIFEVFARQAYAFQERDVETLRGMAEMVTATLARTDSVSEGDDWESLVPADRPQFEIIPGKAPVCPACGGPLDPNSLQCHDCGVVSTGVDAPDPGKPRHGLAGLLALPPGKMARLVVPIGFLVLAAVLAFMPIRRRSTVPETTLVSQSPPLQSINPGKADQAVPGGAPGGTAAEAPDSTTQPPNTSLAGEVKTLLGGVRSDVFRLLASDEVEPAAPSVGNPQAKVWVDTRKGIYYCRADAAYGKTPRGAYMTQHDAQSDYYTPALQKNCD